MFRQLVQWWKVRRCESDLRFLRRLQRENPDDPKPRELLPFVEKEYHKLRAEQVCRSQGWHWGFTCKFCGRENISFIRPVACHYCGLEAPSDVKLTVPELQGSNEPQHEGTTPC
jgi:hypothetical protein